MTASLEAAQVVDDFNRADTLYASSNAVPSTLGGGWIMGQGQDNAEVRIVQGRPTFL